MPHKPGIDAHSAPHARTLPRPATELIGREAEVTEICARFDEGARLVTLTGPGGVGKTRVALAAAERLTDLFPDGIEFISLASIAHHELVIPTIAHALDVAEQADSEILDRLIDRLHERRMLLVLDNFEQVVEAAILIAELLRSCPYLSTLATSRAALHIRGEFNYALEPLPLTAIDPYQPVASLSDNDAVRLFVDRASDVTSRFVLTDANVEAVNAICHHVGGLPLAIELAAARIKVLSPVDLLARLAPSPGLGSLTLLSGGPRDAPDRQQTMRDTIQWSYDLLTDDEQRFFRQATVFPGGWTVDAAEAVIEHSDVLDLLTSLIDKSLVQRLDQPGQPTRYRMLEPIRQFGLELLVQNRDEVRSTRDRRARYLLSLVDGLHARLDGADAVAWNTLIESELDNVRAALRWAMESGDVETGMLLAGQIGKFLHQHGKANEAIAHIEAFLNLPTSRRRTVGRAWAVYGLSWLKVDIGRADLALVLANEARSLFEELEDRYNLGRSLLIRGICHLQLGDLDLALADQQRALGLLRAAGSLAYTNRVLVQLAYLARRRGDLDLWRAYIEEAYALVRAGNSKNASALILKYIGLLAEASGDEEVAAEHYRERIRLSRELGLVPSTAETIELLARVARRTGQFERSACLLGSAAGCRVRSGTPFVVVDHFPIEDELQAVRDALPNDVFQAAWKRGQMMTTAQAIEYALDTNIDIEWPTTTDTGGSKLTPRELDVLRLLVDGKSNQEIAGDLFISPNTVTTHVANIMNKVSLDSRTAVATWAVRNGIV